tara:strand:+ start:123 stop:479 length:357 start_codon:yes stop_codon:yes gene_type:complete
MEEIDTNFMLDHDDLKEHFQDMLTMTQIAKIGMRLPSLASQIRKLLGEKKPNITEAVKLVKTTAESLNIKQEEVKKLWNRLLPLLRRMLKKNLTTTVIDSINDELGEAPTMNGPQLKF